MRVHTQEQRPFDAGVAAIKAHSLRNRQDVRFIEGGGEGGAAVPGRAERDALRGDRGIGR